MAKLNYEHIFAAAGFSGETFDIAAGVANVDVIDVLLSVGDGALEPDAPHMLESTGALGGARALDISGLEAENAAQGGAALNGRFFYLSVRNSDIVASNITVSATGTINGAATLVIATEGDYLFHHSSSGNWRVNILPTPAEGLATIARVPFVVADWAAGTKNEITILQTGVPGAGEVGPHGLTPAGTYVVQIINTDNTPDEMVDAEIQFAANGDITLLKAGLGAAFNGVAIIVGSLD